MGIDINDDGIFENLVSILDQVPFGGNIDVIFEQDAKIKEVIRGLCTEIFDSFDNKLVVNYFGFELQTLTLTKEEGYYLWESDQEKVMTQSDIFKAYKAQEDLPEVLGSLGLDFTDNRIEILFSQINDAASN